MIKKAICVLLAALTALSLCACRRESEPSPAVTNEPEALATETAEPTAAPTAIPSPTAEPTETPEPTEEPAPIVPFDETDIHVYTEHEFFKLFPICWDQCSYDYDAGTFPHRMEDILAAYPTDAVRTRDDGSKYAIYETDTGYRFYLILDSSINGGSTETLFGRGFPIMLKEVHSYADFASLKVGDPLDLAIQIDPVAHFIAEYYEGKTQYRNYIHEEVERGNPIASVHYLSDGLLKIAYDMTEDGELFICDMTYCEDYKLMSHTGYLVDYKLFDCDLPQP